MRTAFWVSLVLVLYTYIGYPVIIWILSRVHPRSWTKAPILPSVSIIMAVHNGETLLAGKIDDLLRHDYPNVLEIIVVSDGSTDGTARILESFKTQRLRPIILQEHSGKAVALNAGIAAASGEILLFVDLRPEITPRSIAQLVSNFSDPSVGCITCELSLRKSGHDGTSAAVSGVYWRYEQWLRFCESRWYSQIGVYGGFYAIRRELATVLPEGTILDDMFLPLSIIRQGFRVVNDEQARVYDTWPEKVDGEFHRKVRTLAGNFQLFYIAPWVFAQGRIIFQLLSHKVSRLMVPYALILLLISSLALSRSSVLFAIMSVLQVGLWLLAILGLRFELRWLSCATSAASALLMLNAAAVVGLHKFLFTKGPLWTIWLRQSPQKADAPSCKAAGR